MKTSEALKKMDNADFLNRIYQFAYRRCNTSHEAEELCSDIILAVIGAVQRQPEIENFHGFVWAVAHRVYADFCEKRSRTTCNASLENMEQPLASSENEIDTFVEEDANAEQLRKIFTELAFLSKAYRDVMVMYYIDEYKVKDIATALHISETTVKQRLFFARNSIRKEVETMNNRNLSLKPIQLAMVGTGSPMGNDPRHKAERIFSQNLIYLCKEKPKTAKELSEELCMPMPYVEEELEIQCRGENGTYGTLRKLENGKYAINILVVDYKEYDEANKIYERHLPAFCNRLKKAVKDNAEKILSFPYLSSQTDTRFILWTLISPVIWEFENKVVDILEHKYFSNITPVNRPFSSVATAYDQSVEPDFAFYGCDGINGASIEGFRNVFVQNVYGQRVEKHFDCGHNISQDAKLLMVLRAIGGLSIQTLTEEEKEVVAKAIECGYLRKNGQFIEPNIIVIEKKHQADFQQLPTILNVDMQEIAENIAEELAAFMKQHIPEHLMNEYKIYTQLIAGTRILSRTIEACIQEGLLTEPQNRLGAEGVLMVVEK